MCGLKKKPVGRKQVKVTCVMSGDLNISSIIFSYLIWLFCCIFSVALFLILQFMFHTQPTIFTKNGYFANHDSFGYISTYVQGHIHTSLNLLHNKFCYELLHNKIIQIITLVFHHVLVLLARPGFLLQLGDFSS